MGDRDSPLVEIATVATPLEAHLLKGRLEAEGLRVTVADEHMIAANIALAYAIGGVRLLVRAPHAARARAVLAAIERGDYAIGSGEEA